MKQELYHGKIKQYNPEKGCKRPLNTPYEFIL